MKRALFALFVLTFTLIAVSCVAIDSDPHDIVNMNDDVYAKTDKYVSKDELNEDIQYIRTNLMVDVNSFPSYVEIKSKQDLINYYENNKEKYEFDMSFKQATDLYQDDFFEKSNIILLLLREGSGSIRHKINDVTVKDSILNIEVKRIIPECGTDDMAEWHIFIPLDKELKYTAVNVDLGIRKNSEPIIDYIRTNGYISGAKYPAVYIINTEQQFTEYYEANKDKYDLRLLFDTVKQRINEKYFDEKVLICGVQEEPRGSIRHAVTQVEAKDDVLNIAIAKNVPERGTADMAQWHIVIEVSKEYYAFSKVNVEIVKKE